MVNILVYTGEHTGLNCDKNTVNILKQRYNVKTTSTITKEALTSIDILVMPGGDGGHAYLDHFNDIEEKLIKQFVFNGGGYFGTCAGAYLGAKEVYRGNGKLYSGLGVAPNITAFAVEYEGLLSVKMKYGTVVTMAEYNGAAMKGGDVLATFNDNNTGFYGYGAIVGDIYGKGKTVLSGPHPELDPQHPEIIFDIITYLTNKGSDNLNFSINSILDAGKRVKEFIEKNKRLPTTCKIDTSQVNMGEFLYLAVSATLQYPNTTPIPYLKALDAPAPTGTYKEGDVSSSTYLAVANTVKAHINNNGKAPNYATFINVGTVPFNDLVNSYAKVLNFININKRLPNTLMIKKITGSTPASVDIVQRIKDETGKQFSNFTELYNLVKTYGRYCNPMYMDNQKSFNQAQTCVINEFKGILDPNAYVQSPISGQWTQRDCMTCVDWTQWGVKVAKAMGYEAIPYGVWCPGYEINHAIFTIRGKEFSNWTVIDLAAAAAENYALGSHWCNDPTPDKKEPNWIIYE